jgi:hypothetical protein
MQGSSGSSRSVPVGRSLRSPVKIPSLRGSQRKHTCWYLGRSFNTVCARRPTAPELDHQSKQSSSSSYCYLSRASPARRLARSLSLSSSRSRNAPCTGGDLRLLGRVGVRYRATFYEIPLITRSWTGRCSCHGQCDDPTPGCGRRRRRLVIVARPECQRRHRESEPRTGFHVGCDKHLRGLWNHARVVR